jgi:hypothetical protein
MPPRTAKQPTATKAPSKSKSKSGAKKGGGLLADDLQSLAVPFALALLRTQLDSKKKSTNVKAKPTTKTGGRKRLSGGASWVPTACDAAPVTTGGVQAADVPPAPPAPPTSARGGGGSKKSTKDSKAKLEKIRADFASITASIHNFLQKY